MTFARSLRLGFSATVLGVLLACGGGGGGSAPAPTAPAITFHPANTTVTAPATAMFSVTATGTAPLSYQWKKGGVAISGATAASYTTPATTTADSGASFTVTVTNSAGSVTSNPATLTVNPAPATTLGYTDPASGTYQLKKNTTLSTASHLVLDLVGPAGTNGAGVSVSFTADAAKVSWVNVATGDAANTFVQNGSAFTLGTAPQILKAKVAGGTIQATVAQKGTGSPVALNAPLLRLALDLKAGIAPGAITLTADAAKCQLLDGAGTIAGITVTVGTLSAQ